MKKPRFSGSMILFTLLLSGCFEEPVPAYKTVKEGQRVYLQERALKSFAEIPAASIALGAEIDYLNLDRNTLTDLNGVEALTGLKWLRLNGNRLSQLPDLKPLTGLRRIYLANNDFKQVPEQLKELKTLTDIDLSGNPITEVPEWMLTLTALENVSFTRTGVTKLPEDLSGWKHLKSLQMGELTLSAAEMSRIRAALPNTAIAF